MNRPFLKRTISTAIFVGLSLTALCAWAAGQHGCYEGKALTEQDKIALGDVIENRNPYSFITTLLGFQSVFKENLHWHLACPSIPRSPQCHYFPTMLTRMVFLRGL